MSFLASLPPHGAARDAHILRAIARGDLDPPRWYRLRMGRAEIDVSRDYLTIGGERVPMSAPVAQAAVDSLDALLPTPAIVDAIEQEPAAIVTWLPTQTPGPGQIGAEAFARCERETTEILAGYLGSDTALLAGHRKDVVIAQAMRKGRVTIYGARRKSGARIQPVSSVHEEGFADYSHAVRAVRRACLLDGRPARLEDVLAAGLCGGPVARMRYPTPAPEPRPTPTISAVLRRGDRGPQVVELQTLLAGAGYATAIDGIFGPGTEASVRGFQAGHGLVVDGLAGPRTLTALRSLGDTERPPPDVPPALSDAEVDDLFGPLIWTPAPTASEPGAIRITNNWTAACLRMVEIPQLRGIHGAPANCKVPLHVLIVEQTCALWAAWEKAGLLPLVRSWAGSWNPRLMRGGSTLSRHAYAVGWDINAAWNPMGKAPAPRGEPGSVVELVPLAVEHGYTWGGTWSRPDGMHFETVRAL